MTEKKATTLAKALVKAQSEFPPIDLNSTVEVRKDGRFLYAFDYATLGHIKELTDPILHKNGLAVIHLRDGSTLVSQLVHESGEVKESKTTLRISERASQQEEGSVVSYQKRYNHSGLLGIVAEKDDDANIADGQEASQPTNDKRSDCNPKSNDTGSKSQPYVGAKKGNPPNFKFLQSLKPMKKEMGDEAYYQVLGNHGYEHANEITDRSHQIAVFKEMDMVAKATMEMNEEAI